MQYQQAAMQYTSVHSSDEVVDEHFPVSMVTTLDEMPCLLAETSPSIAELERPKEVISLSEVGSHREDLMNEVLHADDATLAQRLLNDGVFSERYASPIHLAKSSLVDQLTDTLQIRVPAVLHVSNKHTFTNRQPIASLNLNNSSKYGQQYGEYIHTYRSNHEQVPNTSHLKAAHNGLMHI